MLLINEFDEAMLTSCSECVVGCYVLLTVDYVHCVHREGIQFVINTQSYPFLEILCEFSGKLMKQDKKVVYVDFIVSFHMY